MKADPKRIARLKPQALSELVHFWPLYARDEQLPPRTGWTTWLLMGGRGAGKTRAGAEWIRNLASRGIGPLALVGQTISEAKAVMVKGESGLFRVTPPDERPLLRGDNLL